MIELFLWIIGGIVFQYISFFAVFILLMRENSGFMIAQIEIGITQLVGTNKALVNIVFYTMVMFWEIAMLCFGGWYLVEVIKERNT